MASFNIQLNSFMIPTRSLLLSEGYLPVILPELNPGSLHGRVFYLTSSSGNFNIFDLNDIRGIIVANGGCFDDQMHPNRSFVTGYNPAKNVTDYIKENHCEHFTFPQLFNYINMWGNDNDNDDDNSENNSFL